MLEITSSAPAKVILFGEHAVVYGAPAIAASIDRRTTAKLRTVQDRNLHIKFLNLDMSFPLPLRVFDLGSYVSQDQQQALNCINIIYGNLSEKVKGESVGLSLEVTSNFPVGAGLGSSAGFSLSVCSVFFAYDYIVNKHSPFESHSLSNDFIEVVKKIANECERVFHGNPSGIDIATCSLGGIIKFKKNEPAEKLAETLPLKIAVVDSKVSRNTSKVIKDVTELTQRLGGVTNSIMDNISLVVNTAIEEIIKPDPSLSNILDLVRINHGLLYCLGVSHPVLEQIGIAVADIGVSFKLTGAGRGGNAIIFIPPSIPENIVTEALRKSGFSASIVNVGVPGLALDIKRL